MTIEVCANGYESAKAAKKAGANRIELCSQLSVGGLTPSLGLVQKVLSEMGIETHVLIRPRAGGFNYSEAEIDIMVRDIIFCKEAGCSGVVSGALTDQNDLDVAATQRLLDAAGAMDFTFHRAFDLLTKPLEVLKQLETMGVTRILTSGQQAKAINGLPLLKKLLSLSQQIEILPGSGINLENASTFKKEGFRMIHFSAIGKPIQLKNTEAVSFSNGIEGVSDETTIRKIIELVQG